MWKFLYQILPYIEQEKTSVKTRKKQKAKVAEHILKRVWALAN